MNTFTRLVAGTLGAGVLAVTATATASAAPETTQDSASQDAPTVDPTGRPAEPVDGAGAPTYILDGVAAPLPGPAFGAVPQVLEVGVLPFSELAHAAGQDKAQPGPAGAQAGPGSAES